MIAEAGAQAATALRDYQVRLRARVARVKAFVRAERAAAKKDASRTNAELQPFSRLTNAADSDMFVRDDPFEDLFVDVHTDMSDHLDVVREILREFGFRLTK